MIAEQLYLDAVASLALGNASVETVADRLYVDATPSDLRRLGMHQRYGGWYRGMVLETHFPECRACVIGAGGPSVWSALVAGYFRSHPPRRLPMHHNAGRFPEFVAGRAQAVGLPGFVAEVADLEWLEWQVTTLDEHAAEREEPAALQVTPTLREQTYRHDLVAWLDGDRRGSLPERRPSTVLVWRDRQLVAQRATLGRLDLAILGALRRGADLRVLPREVGAPQDDVLAAVGELHDAGVLRGKPDWVRPDGPL